MAMSVERSDEPGSQQRKRRSMTPYLGVALVIIAAGFGAAQIIRSCARAPGEAVQSVAAGLRGAFLDAYRSDVHVLVHSAVTSVSKDSKLVVYTVTFTTSAEAKKESALWGLLGTTSSRVVTLENKAQYSIPVAGPAGGGIGGAKFHYDEQAGVLRVSIPPPRLDEEMVVVQTDPSKIMVQTSAGWASLKAFEGREVEDAARAQLRANVVEEARKEVYLSAARENARTVVAAHVYGVLREHLKPGVRVEVDIQDAAPATSTTSTNPPTAPTGKN